YEPVAQKLAAGAGLVLGSKPALRYPPGIPMLYAATFWISDSLDISHGAGLRIFQSLFVIASGVLVGVVAMRFLSLRIALAASIFILRFGGLSPPDLALGSLGVAGKRALDSTLHERSQCLNRRPHVWYCKGS